METQRNADDGISAESVNEKAKQGGQGEEKLSSCFCCGGDTGKSGSIRPLLIADADQIIQTDLIQLRQTDGNGDRQLPDAFFISGIHIAVAAEIVGNLADRQIAVRAQILQSLIFHDSSPLRNATKWSYRNGRILPYGYSAFETVECNKKEKSDSFSERKRFILFSQFLHRKTGKRC